MAAVSVTPRPPMTTLLATPVMVVGGGEIWRGTFSDFIDAFPGLTLLQIQEATDHLDACTVYHFRAGCDGDLHACRKVVA